MTTKKFGHAMDDKMGAMLQRSTEDRGGKGVVNAQQHTLFVGQPGQTRQIGQSERGIGYGLNIDEPGPWGHRGANGVGVGGVDKGRRDTEANQLLSQEQSHIVVAVFRGDDMIARP